MKFDPRSIQPKRTDGPSSLWFGLMTIGAAVIAGGLSGIFVTEFIDGTPGASGLLHDQIERQINRTAQNSDAPSRGDGSRVGHAELASAFDTCADVVESSFGSLRTDRGVDRQYVYFSIRHGNSPASYVDSVGSLIECAIDRIPQEMCEPDNRALVVEAVGRYLSFDDRLNNSTKQRDRATQSDRSRQREQILLGIRDQFRAGRLALADFGWFPHRDIRKASEGAESVVSSCPS